MSLLATLTQEHALFAQLLGRLERALIYEEDAARSEVRNTLLLLLPALDRHERLEDLLFGDLASPAVKAVKGLLAQAELQRAGIQVLRDEIVDLLRGSGEERVPRLKVLVADLCARLRAHFRMEETRLWPAYPDAGRSPGRALEREAQRRVEELEAEMRQNWGAISDYLERTR